MYSDSYFCCWEDAHTTGNYNLLRRVCNALDLCGADGPEPMLKDGAPLPITYRDKLPILMTIKFQKSSTRIQEAQASILGKPLALRWVMDKSPMRL